MAGQLLNPTASRGTCQLAGRGMGTCLLCLAFLKHVVRLLEVGLQGAGKCALGV